MVAKIHLRHIVRNGLFPLCRLHYLIRRHEKEFGLRINEFFDQPRTGHPVHFDFFASNPFHSYFPTGTRSKRSPPSAMATPKRRMREAGSLKNKIPATAIIAAPPPRIMGTEESGPPFWKRRKKKMVPIPTQTPVRAENQTPGADAV